MAEKITMRLQTPPDESGKRKDIHLVTSTDEVIVNDSFAGTITLTEKLDGLGDITVSEEMPKKPGIWAKVINVDN